MTAHSTRTPAPSDKRLFAPATERNQQPIFETLSPSLPEGARVLEIAAGSGQHAVYFAKRRRDLIWLPTEINADALDSIAAWTAAEGCRNVLSPRAVHVEAPVWPVKDLRPFHGIVCINMLHIAPWSSALGLFAGTSRLLHPHGRLFLYGPFKIDNQHTAPTNEAFDADLKARNPAWGIRDIADLDRAAQAVGLQLEARHEMPANNQILVFSRA